MSAAYRSFMDGLANDDYVRRRQRMEPIIKEVYEMSGSGHMREPSTRLKAYLKQFEELVRLVAWILVQDLSLTPFIGHLH
jgi:hypothetical protein